jgi:hypothetical protein
VNEELGRMWKEAVVDKFKELSRHLLGGTDENHKYLRITGVYAKFLKCF